MLCPFPPLRAPLLYAPYRSAPHCAAALSSAGHDQTGPQLLLQVHEPRRGPTAARCRVTCLHLKLCLPVSRYSECRTALFRHRFGFTSKTLPHVHQPYVVKVSFNPRHVPRRAATRHLAILHISLRCCASRSDSPLSTRPPVTIKPAPHLGQPYVVKPGFLPRSETFRYARCRIATHSLSVYDKDRLSSWPALRGEGRVLAAPPSALLPLYALSCSSAHCCLFRPCALHCAVPPRIFAPSLSVYD